VAYFKGERGEGRVGKPSYKVEGREGRRRGMKGGGREGRGSRGGVRIEFGRGRVDETLRRTRAEAACGR